jgi:GMP synthase (glutamine-hydrolysing)
MDQPVRSTARSTAYVIRHVAFEDLGSFGPLLERQGYAIHYADAGYDELVDSNSDLLIVLGGPIGANDDADYPFIRDELRLIERRAQANKPVLGICLGSQLIARALGAKVYRAKAKEIGYKPLQLTDAGQQSCLAPLAGTPVFHWHGDTFDLPAGARHLASTDICPHQAFAWGNDDSVLALQFHPEVTARGLERWYIGHTGELAAVGLSIPQLRADAARHNPALEASAGDVVPRWLATINTDAIR